MTEQHFIQLGLRIKQLRTTKNLTQNQLADKCNFEKSSISRIESGQTNLTLRSLHKISQALDIQLVELFTN